MALGLPRLRPLDHTATAWASEQCESLATRSGALKLYQRLIENGEIGTPSTPRVDLREPRLPEYDRETPTDEEQDHYLTELLLTEKRVCRWALSGTPFARATFHRQSVLRRVLTAIINRYLDTVREEQRSRKTPEHKRRDVEVEERNLKQSKRTETEVLIELGVKTGLALLFSLLRQAWTAKESGSIEICNSVLRTACSVLSGLPPGSLAGKMKMGPLGWQSLEEVTEFLVHVAMPNSPADTSGRQLALELLLLLALQRASLVYLLGWIDIAMKTNSGVKQPVDGDDHDCGAVKVPTVVLQQVITEVIKAVVRCRLSLC